MIPTATETRRYYDRQTLESQTENIVNFSNSLLEKFLTLVGRILNENSVPHIPRSLSNVYTDYDMSPPPNIQLDTIEGLRIVKQSLPSVEKKPLDNPKSSRCNFKQN
jgi:hypothetical protein